MIDDIHVNYGRLEGIHITHDDSRDDIAYCASCVDPIGSCRIKMRLSQNHTSIYCRSCENVILIQFSVEDQGVRRLKLIDEHDKQYVIIVSPVKVQEELDEFRALKARYS